MKPGSNRICVVKVGSAVVAQEGTLRPEVIHRLAGEIAQLHERAELEPMGDINGAPEKAARTLFNYAGQDLTIDASTLTGTATWPTLSAQASQILPFEASLLVDAHRLDQWGIIEATWRTIHGLRQGQEQTCGRGCVQRVEGVRIH